MGANSLIDDVTAIGLEKSRCLMVYATRENGYTIMTNASEREVLETTSSRYQSGPKGVETMIVSE